MFCFWIRISANWFYCRWLQRQEEKILNAKKSHKITVVRIAFWLLIIIIIIIIITRWLLRRHKMESNSRAPALEVITVRNSMIIIIFYSPDWIYDKRVRNLTNINKKYFFKCQSKVTSHIFWLWLECFCHVMTWDSTVNSVLNIGIKLRYLALLLCDIIMSRSCWSVTEK